MAEPWRLERQLCDIARERDLAQAIVSLSLASEADRPYHLAPLSTKWERLGAESYVYFFSVESQAGSTRFVLKAHAPDVPTRPVGESFQDLMDRRRMLEHLGVRTPRLYGYRNATLLEDFLPLTLRKALDSSAGRSPEDSLSADVLTIGRALNLLRFDARGWLDGLRSDGPHAYMVDFGTDLGPPFAVRKPPGYLDQATAFLMNGHRHGDSMLPVKRSVSF